MLVKWLPLLDRFHVPEAGISRGVSRYAESPVSAFVRRLLGLVLGRIHGFSIAGMGLSVSFNSCSLTNRIFFILLTVFCILLLCTEKCLYKVELYVLAALYYT